MDLIPCSNCVNNSTQIIFITNTKTTRNVGEKNPRICTTPVNTNKKRSPNNGEDAIFIEEFVDFSM